MPKTDSASFIKKLARDIGVDESQVHIGVDDIPSITMSAENLVANCQKLREKHAYAFSQLSDITAVDYPESELRFKLVYHLLSMATNYRLRLLVWLAEEETIDSLRGIYPCADWYEREVWDMYGVFFNNHPDLRRILTDYGFQGHPQRKDFPLTGHVEVRYDSETRRVCYDKVDLVQDFRDFDFLSPWQGMPNKGDNSDEGDDDGEAKA